MLKDNLKFTDKDLENMKRAIDEYEHKVNEFSSQRFEEAHHHLEKIQKEFNSFDRRLKQLKNASKDAYVDLSLGVNIAWLELNDALESAKNRMNTEK